jgi:DNA-binding response OmpR family regulator
MPRILVVEADPHERSMLRMIFEIAGHEVAEAEDGAAALRSVGQSRPDLVVIDIMMPVRGGTEFIQQLRDAPATAAVPILASSAGCHFACSPDIVLFKPSGEHVLAIARALLAVSSGSSAATTAETGSAASLRVLRFGMLPVSPGPRHGLIKHEHCGSDASRPAAG